MKMRLLIYAVSLLVLTCFLSTTAAVRVTNVHLEKKSTFTDVTIDCDGPFEYGHQIVEATDGKPYRIVVDIRNALHGLPQMNYTDLPQGSIRQIRTSQYSTKPENVVRVVFDVAGSLTYKINKSGNSLVLSVNTPNDKPFSLWSGVNGRQSGGTTSAKADPPSVMPAYPGKESSTPKADTKAEGPKLAAKPVDEGKLLNKDAHTKPLQVEQNSKPIADNAAVKTSTTPAAGKESTAPAKAAADTKPATTSTPKATKESAATSQPKHADSSQMPMPTLQEISPKKESPDAVKTPKAEKSALPETKVEKRPTTAEVKPADERQAAQKGSTTVNNQPEKTAPANIGKGTADSAHAKTTQPESKSEAVHQKYSADDFKPTTSGTQPELPAAADAGTQPAEQSGIDRIREKYKRGIKFVRDEADEQRLADEEATQSDSSDLLAEGQESGEFASEREVVIYTSHGLRDPFAPLIENAYAADDKLGLPNVETLRLIGILQDQKGSRALFEDVDGYSYILQVGDRVKNGYLVTIEEARVVFQIRQYGWSRTMALELEDEL